MVCTLKRTEGPMLATDSQWTHNIGFTGADLTRHLLMMMLMMGLFCIMHAAPCSGNFQSSDGFTGTGCPTISGANAPCQSYSCPSGSNGPVSGRVTCKDGTYSGALFSTCVGE